MARQDKRSNNDPYGPDAWGLVTHLRDGLRKDFNPTHKGQYTRWIRWVLAARRAIERAAK
jgi:hypothetical protein